MTKKWNVEQHVDSSTSKNSRDGGTGRRGSWFGAFPDARVDVHCVHIVDDVAIEEGTFTGTHNGLLKGPMGDVPPTGRPVRIAYIQVLRFRDGKHVSLNLMFDRLSMLEQLGLIPAPSPTVG
jgi:predicted ester cyclase